MWPITQYKSQISHSLWEGFIGGYLHKIISRRFQCIANIYEDGRQGTLHFKIKIKLRKKGTMKILIARPSNELQMI